MRYCFVDTDRTDFERRTKEFNYIYSTYSDYNSLIEQDNEDLKRYAYKKINTEGMTPFFRHKKKFTEQDICDSDAKIAREYSKDIVKLFDNPENRGGPTINQKLYPIILERFYMFASLGGEEAKKYMQEYVDNIRMFYDYYFAEKDEDYDPETYYYEPLDKKEVKVLLEMSAFNMEINERVKQNPDTIKELRETCDNIILSICDESWKWWTKNLEQQGVAPKFMDKLNVDNLKIMDKSSAVLNKHVMMIHVEWMREVEVNGKTKNVGFGTRGMLPAFELKEKTMDIAESYIKKFLKGEKNNE